MRAEQIFFIADRWMNPKYQQTKCIELVVVLLCCLEKELTLTAVSPHSDCRPKIQFSAELERNLIAVFAV